MGVARSKACLLDTGSGFSTHSNQMARSLSSDRCPFVRDSSGYFTSCSYTESGSGVWTNIE